MIGDYKWYQSTLNETCIQDALNNYLEDYPYLDGYTPSQADVKIYNILNSLDVQFTNYPHLYRWYNHMETFNEHEKAVFRIEQNTMLPQCTCKDHKKNNNSQVSIYILLIFYYHKIARLIIHFLYIILYN